MDTSHPFTMARETLISVIMSVHNGEAYLKPAIESILSQTFIDFEFIIIDDCSTDDSLKIIQSYTDPRIVIIKNETNIGLTKSLNKALAVSKGVYVARMDADDVSLPDRLRIEKTFLDTNPDIVCVGSSVMITDKHGTLLSTKYPPQKPELLKFYLMVKNQMIHPSVMFRKDAILAQGGYDETIRFTQDYALWSRLLHARYKFSNIHEPLIRYRSHDTSITQGKNKDTAYRFSRDTVVKNLSKYISADTNDLEILVDALHMRGITSLRNLYTSQKNLKQFTKKYIAKEKVNSEDANHIKDYMRAQARNINMSYARSHFAILFKIAKKILR